MWIIFFKLFFIILFTSSNLFAGVNVDFHITIKTKEKEIKIIEKEKESFYFLLEDLKLIKKENKELTTNKKLITNVYEDFFIKLNQNSKSVYTVHKKYKQISILDTSTKYKNNKVLTKKNYKQNKQYTIIIEKQ